MIMLDQFRNDSRNCHPVFEEMKRRGILFSQVITYAPYTVASLHATFTGMYGKFNGVNAYTGSDHYDKNGCLSLPEYLQKVGYWTQGYGYSRICFPNTGFDRLDFVGEEEEKDVLESHRRVLIECYAKKKPFFTFLHYGEIHHQVVREVIKKYDDYDDRFFGKTDENRIRYEEHTKHAGEYAASILHLIDELDPNENTLIIFFTDHGGGLGEKPGEKAYGIFTYDYTLCVWTYFIYPKLLPSGIDCRVQVRNIDILPTLIDLLDLSISKKHKPILGRSLMPIVRGEEKEHRLAFSETGGVDGPHPSPNSPNVHCLRNGTWKLIFNSMTNRFELYNLKEDPYETKNYYSTNRQKADELWRQMVEYL